MAIILDNVFEPNKEYTLTCLPRKGNGIFNKIKNLKVGDVFIFKTSSPNGLLMLHKKTGILHPLQASFFVNSDRFYYTHSRKEVATALITNDNTSLVGNKGSQKVSIGTIFDNFKNSSDTHFTVTVNNGEEYQILKSAVSKLCDIEYVDTLSEYVSTLVQELKDEDCVKESSERPSNLFDYSITVNGVSFKSLEESAKAEAFSKDVLEVISKHGLKDSLQLSKCLALVQTLLEKEVVCN